MTNAKIDDVTQEEFNKALEELVDEMTGAEILATAGAYEVFSEALNNEAIDRARKTKEEDEEEENDDDEAT